MGAPTQIFHFVPRFTRTQRMAAHKIEVPATMRLFLLVAALVAAVTLMHVEGSFSSSAIKAPQRWTNKKLAFGLVQRLARGGAAPTEQTEEAKQEGEPVELYLPGMLEVSISKAKKVSL